MENGPLINILIRNCYRPNSFKECIKSIYEQNYKNLNLIMCYDDDNCLEYLKNELDIININSIKLIKVERNINIDWFYNLYVNKLLDLVESGWIMFLDDDDKFTEIDSLKCIIKNITSENDLIHWKFNYGPGKIYLKDLNIIKAGEIANSSYIFHSKHKDKSRWESSDIGDYLFIKNLNDLINFNRKFINKVLTGTINNSICRNYGKDEHVSNKIDAIPKGDINRYNIIGIDPCPGILKSIFIDGIEYNENVEINLITKKNKCIIEYGTINNKIDVSNKFSIIPTKKIIIFIPYCIHFKKYINECLDSVLKQCYINYEIIIINDGDKFFSIENKDYIKIINSPMNSNLGPAYSKYLFFKYMNDNKDKYSNDDIIIILDGDDYLIGKDVFNKLNSVYGDNNILMTCGNFGNTLLPNELIVGKDCINFINDKNRRKNLIIKGFKYPHLRTFKFNLIHRLNYSDLFNKIENKYIQNATDVLIFINLLDLCEPENVYIIKDIIYYYRQYDKNCHNIINNYSFEEKKQLKYIQGLKCNLDLDIFIKQNGITQLYVSDSLKHLKNRFMKKYNLSDYNDFTKPSLFFGLYDNLNTLKIENHTSKKYLILGGTDVDIGHLQKLKLNEICIISISKNIKERLKEQNIESNYVIFNLVDTKIFKPIKKKGNKIFIYNGFTKIPHNDRIYGQKYYSEVMKLLPEYEYIFSENLNLHNDKMPDVYSKCFIGLRLTMKDGNANTVQEFEAMNIPIVHNQSDYGLKWKNTSDIINHIKLNILNNNNK